MARAAVIASDKRIPLNERLRAVADSSWSHSSTYPYRQLMREAAAVLETPRPDTRFADLAAALAGCKPDSSDEPSAWACWDGVIEGVAATLALADPDDFRKACGYP